MRAKAKAIRQTFALDLGTTKFCIAALREHPGRSGYRVQTVSVPADGMRRGMLSHRESALTALRSLIETAERELAADIEQVVVGIAGSHLKSRLVSGSQSLDAGRVRPEDMRRLIERVESHAQTETRELLHVVPLGYRLDGRETVDDPLGFSGRTLFGDFFLIDADRFYLKDVVELCNEAGLAVRRLYSEPFASASVTVPDPFKELGCAVADIGGGTTDGLVFLNGRPRAAFTVNVAGKLMTSDVAIGLNLPNEAAEALKVRFGLLGANSREEPLEVLDLKGQPRKLDGRHVLPILGPRAQELGVLLAKQLLPFKGTLGAGLVLTGGGSEVKGLAPFFEQRLGVPVRKAKPTLPASESEAAEFHPTRHATALGLLNLEIARLNEEAERKQTNWSRRYLGQFFNWLRELS